MLVKIKQMETIHREVTYMKEFPDNSNIHSISIDVDRVIEGLTPQFGQETIIDVETVSVEKI